MANTFLDELRNLNYSNQMDNGEHPWAALCNLLGDYVDNVNSLEDLPVHERRVACEGFKSDAELCRYMSEQIVERTAKLMCIAQRLRHLSMLHMIREHACGK